MAAALARLKADARLVAAIEPAVGLYEEPPTEGMEVTTPWGDVWVGTADWADAFDAPPPAAAHNESRDVVWEALLGILVTAALFLRALQRLFTGPVRGRSTGFVDLRSHESVSVGLLVGLAVALGVAPRLLLDVIEPAAQSVVTLVSR